MQHDALRLVRVFHDMSQTELAGRLGISKSYLSELERGEKKKISLDLLDRYSDIFAIPVSSLVFFAEQIVDGKSDNVRMAITGKVVKMLEWMSAKGAV
jgi:transcriptional regulator with XRE-family HTH domain